jgi:surfactin synthase thioesterase subunit
VDSILPLLAATDTPYSLVGACSGAITAYETARAIYQLDVPPPASLIVISQPNPSRTSSQNPEGYIPMTTGKARELLRVNGNLADEFLTSEVVELFYDTLDADYAAYSGYRYVPAAKLACNIVAVRGTLDSQFSAETAAEWSEFTSSSFELRHVAGRSRLIDDAPDGIAELIGSLRTSCG